MSAARHVVVVGAGLGGLRTVEALRAEGYPGRISLVGEETHPPYDRPPLSKEILASRWPDERAILRDAAALAELDVELHLGVAATGVDGRAVQLADGALLAGDALVVATGVRPRRLPGQPDHPRVHLLRTLDDCRALRASLQDSRSLLVIGAGFIGAEVAATARTAGLEVTIVEALATPFERVLGARMGRLCARLAEEHGVAVRAGSRLEEFVDAGDGVAVRLADGTVLRAGCAVVGIGSSPDGGWLAGLGVPTSDGLRCDAHGLVEGTDGVFAVGDVAAWPHPTRGDVIRIEHWTSATEQAAVVAQRIAGTEISRQADAVPYFWSDQYGLKLQLVGRPELADRVEVLHDPGVTKGTVAGYFAGGTLVAALAFHSPRLLNRCRRLVATGAGEREVRDAAAELAS
ncbi:MAG: NAD(P)/FAD-dependent oxidoreductase [Pseudonocardiaceae bacterium]